MTDFEAIYDLITKAKYVKEAEDREGFASVWTEDATLRTIANGKAITEGVNGRAAIMAFTCKNWAAHGHGRGDGREVHIAERPYLMSVAPNRVKAIYNVIFTAFHGDEPILIGFGEFEDEVVKQDGKWLIQHRRNVLRRRKPIR
jgi:hypothetical protein